MLQHSPAVLPHHHLLQQQHHPHHQQHQQPHHVYAPQVAYRDPALLAPGYRLAAQRETTVAEQRQQHQLALVQQRQHQQQQQQAAGYYAHPARHYHQPDHLVQQREVLANQQRHLNMAFPVAQMSEEELAAMQKASLDWQPEIEGPLVGQRQPTSNITTEYARADPVYQVKTAALPQKYAYYRTVRGDGRCGWRAVAYGFLECLVKIGDSSRFLQEEARIRSLANVINAAGFEPYLYEDFADELYGLIRRLGAAVDEGTGDENLLEAFNDENTQNCIITHMRTLTAAWMLTRPENYLGYMQGQSVKQYVDDQIMPYGAEIDHLGLSALKDVLLSPASIALEVMYLDRSEGNEANLHRFDPVNGYTAATVRVLYRPGHYDLLYKPEDVPAPPPTAVTTYLQFHSSQDYVFSEVPEIFADIPGMTFAHPAPGWMACNGFGSDFTMPTPTDQICAQSIPASVVPSSQAQAQPHAVAQQTFGPATHSTLAATPPEHHPHGLAIRTTPQVTYTSMQSPTYHANGPFRPSMWERDENFLRATSGNTFQTSVMRNSPLNNAHFRNDNFQPIEWKPDDEYETTTSKARSKSFG